MALHMALTHPVIIPIEQTSDLQLNDSSAISPPLLTINMIEIHLIMSLPPLIESTSRPSNTPIPKPTALFSNKLASVKTTTLISHTPLLTKTTLLQSHTKTHRARLRGPPTPQPDSITSPSIPQPYLATPTNSRSKMAIRILLLRFQDLNIPSMVIIACRHRPKITPTRTSSQISRFKLIHQPLSAGVPHYALMKDFEWDFLGIQARRIDVVLTATLLILVATTKLQLDVVYTEMRVMMLGCMIWLGSVDGEIFDSVTLAINFARHCYGTSPRSQLFC